MADSTQDVIIKYKADITGLKPVTAELGRVSDAVDEVGNSVKAAFNGKAIDEANDKLDEHVNKIKNVESAYENANQELRALTNQISSGQLEGEALRKATQRAAELKDNIGDVRDEIKRLSSDTRVFDLVAEGARGIAGAMSFAAGAAALFGSENQNLQKALAKAQGAMALLQGAQELATIATTKGGIATKAYGFAIQVVDKIQKAFAISSAAAWAVATAGIGLAVAALAYFITSADDAKESTEELSKVQEIYANQSANRFAAATIDEANALKQQVLASKDATQAIEIQLAAEQKLQESYKQRLAALQPALDALKRDGFQNDANFDHLNKIIKETDKLRLESQERVLGLQKQLGAAQQAFIDNDIKKTREARKLREEGEKQYIKAAVEYFGNFFKRIAQMKEDADIDEPLITEKTITETKDNAEDLAIAYKLAMENTKKTAEEITADVAKVMDTVANELEEVGKVITGITGIFLQGLEAESKNLEVEKANQLAIEKDHTEQQLAMAGNDAKKREAILAESEARKAKIERDAAIKSAQLERQKAVLNKTIALVNATVNTASAIAKALTDSPFPLNIANAAFAAALGAIQIASIASTPLPEIPTFEKSGMVPIMGGEIRRDGMIVGRRHSEGGVLIEAEGGEYVNHRKASAQYYDELKAANEGNFENLIYDKYIQPALERQAMTVAEQQAYDDWKVVSQLRQGQKGDRKNAEFIVEGVTKAVAENAYYQNRYFK